MLLLTICDLVLAPVSVSLPEISWGRENNGGKEGTLRGGAYCSTRASNRVPVEYASALQRHLQVQDLLPAHVLPLPDFNQGTQTTWSLPKEFKKSVSCSGQGAGRMSGAETIQRGLPPRPSWGPRCRHHFEMKKSRDPQETSNPSLNEKLKGASGVEGLSRLEAQLVSCGPGQPGGLPSWNVRGGAGRARGSQRSSALHRASRAARQSPLTASCRQESQVLERPHRRHHGPGAPLPPSCWPGTVRCRDFCTKLTKDSRVLQGHACVRSLACSEGRAGARGDALGHRVKN